VTGILRREGVVYLIFGKILNVTQARRGIHENKEQDEVHSVIQKGSALGQDAMNRAKPFNEKHRLRVSASEKVSSFDQRMGLSQKFNVDISVVNEKVSSVDQWLHVPNKTMAAITVAEKN
jgi:hypothetical protein